MPSPKYQEAIATFAYRILEAGCIPNRPIVATDPTLWDDAIAEYPVLKLMLQDIQEELDYELSCSQCNNAIAWAATKPLPEWIYLVTIQNELIDRICDEICKEQGFHHLFSQLALGNSRVFDADAIAKLIQQACMLANSTRPIHQEIGRAIAENCKKFFSDKYEYIEGYAEIALKRIETEKVK